MIKHTNNQNRNPNPNQIQLTGFGCIYCGKNYKTKINLQKHQVLCETLVRAKKEKNSNNEEEFATPTTKQMYKIILDLSIKCNHLEEKMEQMQKWVIQKRKKINILDWLNENQIPSQSLEDWIQSIQIQEKEIEMILHRSFIEVLGEIGDRIFQMELKEQTDVLPIFAFTQKQNTLYVFHEKEWKEWKKPELIHTFNQLHFQYAKTFIEWKRKNEDKINASDSLCELINKANIKLMGIHFKEDSMYHKGKALFYNKLKKELTSIVEYEYQF